MNGYDVSAPFPHNDLIRKMIVGGQDVEQMAWQEALFDQILHEQLGRAKTPPHEDEE